MNLPELEEELAAGGVPALGVSHSAVLATLYERVMRDCLAADKHLSITDIIGILDVIKMSLFNNYHKEIALEMSELIRGDMVEN